MDDDYAKNHDLETFFLLLSAALVFFMQVGFSLLEVGSVRAKNTKNILMKNIFDGSIGIVCWTIIADTIAFGKDWHGIVGTSHIIARDHRNSGLEAYEWAHFLFEWAFVSTSATIVSGAVAERIQFRAYVVFSVVLISFTYPFIAHWVWHEHGWLSVESSTPLFGCGVLDLAGAGVVHITGGISALVAVFFLGPRDGVTFDPSTNRKVAPEGQSVIFRTIGALMLWFGWFGFNGGSVLFLTEHGVLPVARAMVMTCISAGVAGVVTGILTYLIDDQFLLGDVHNGILTGLVSITAGCATMAVEGAFMTGLIAAAVYLTLSRYLERCKLDDVVGAVAVHAGGGIWGLIAAGLFTTQSYYKVALGSSRKHRCSGVLYGGQGRQLAANIAGILIITLWSFIWSSLTCYILERREQLRVSSLSERAGIDLMYHNEQNTPSVMSAPFAAMDETHGNARRNPHPQGFKTAPSAIELQRNYLDEDGAGRGVMLPPSSKREESSSSSTSVGIIFADPLYPMDDSLTDSSHHSRERLPTLDEYSTSSKRMKGASQTLS